MYQEILRLALPAVFEQFIIFAATLVNVSLAGHLGANELAAFGLANQLMNMNFIVVMPLAVGGGVLVAQAIGADDELRAHLALGQSVLLGLVVGISLALLYIVCAVPALRLIGANADSLGPGVLVLRWMALAFPFHGVFFVARSCLRGAGDTRTPLYVISVVAIVQVFLANALVKGLFGLPDLGVVGIPAGILIGQIVGTSLIAFGLFSGHLRLSFRKVNWRPNRPIVGAIFRVGNPAGGEQLALRLGQMANVRLIADLGTVAFAANVVAFNSISTAYVIGIGFTAAATTLVGQQVGARNLAAARLSARRVWNLAAIAMGLFGVVCIIWTRPVLNLFTDELRVIEQAVIPLQLAALVLPAEAANQVLGGAMRGAGDSRWPMLTTAWGNWLVRLPLTILLARHMGLLGAWLAVVADIVLRALANAWRFRGETWLSFRSVQKGGVYR
jgi:putative MATE family efflux protein